ncbi:Lrp/AsnC family transcriptional regulator [Alkalilimnicola sp. S0819]|uniref:Lrp/AsnC family transcriptional regulator n=1 Tax=Alkalilimnicola sp. S0819 TaxID=2613922 RepID=UPI001261B397|nr:Lrp/AsnC ligand binding domain-containing protein [Alkalilimnicola sp. S0819]KAB7622571.1 Lrp/AsnC family transcriptional regulator [Alkalilimnicola sp. S0819]MPQ17459.1 Lrp/AsnC family transcriptional regulator [Alkalilimnicola sp. S0819]
MVTAIILLNAERGKVNEVAEALVEVNGVSEVYSVGGRYDLVVILRVASNEKLAELVTEHLQPMPGIADTETLIAFRTQSQHDLERMFAIGL